MSMPDSIFCKTKQTRRINNELRIPWFIVYLSSLFGILFYMHRSNITWRESNMHWSCKEYLTWLVFFCQVTSQVKSKNEKSKSSHVKSQVIKKNFQVKSKSSRKSSKKFSSQVKQVKNDLTWLWLKSFLTWLAHLWVALIFSLEISRNIQYLFLILLKSNLMISYR